MWYIATRYIDIVPNRNSPPAVLLRELAERQEELEEKLFERHAARKGEVPVLYLYDVTSSYLEGETLRIETDVAKNLADTRTVHERYRDLALVERDFRTLKTGALEVRPIFLRKGGRTRGHVFVAMLALKIQRELENRLWPVFRTTNEIPHTVTVRIFHRRP